MNNLHVRLLPLVGLLVLCIGCNHGDSSPRNSAARPEVKAAQPTTSPVMLDLIVGGPFVFVQKDDSMIIWVPKVKGHGKPLGVGLGDEIRSFDQADYDFTKGILPAPKTKILVPVEVASMWSLSRNKQNLSEVAKKKPFLTIRLPIPREIVPWNADPITVSDSATGANSAPTPRLSTTTILRYELQTDHSLEMTAQGQPTWKPRPIEVGTERFILLAVIPPKPKAGEDEHKHARDAFDEVTKLVGVSRKVDFPNVTYTRNEPLIPGVLPDDLLKILGVNVSPPTDAEQAHFATLSTIFGHINDCKAPTVLLAP